MNEKTDKLFIESGADAGKCFVFTEVYALERASFIFHFLSILRPGALDSALDDSFSLKDVLQLLEGCNAEGLSKFVRDILTKHVRISPDYVNKPEVLRTALVSDVTDSETLKTILLKFVEFHFSDTIKV